MTPRTRRGRVPWVRSVLVVLGSVVALVVAAGPASAHDVLASTDPANGSTVAAVPTTVTLTFEEPAVALGTKIVVTGPGGEVQQDLPVLVDNTVRQGLRAGAPAGRYTVDWRVTSADGHPISGSFTFNARAAGTGQSAPPSESSPVQNPGTASPGSAALWPWVLACVVLAFVIVAAVAIGRRAVGRVDGEDEDEDRDGG